MVKAARQTPSEGNSNSGSSDEEMNLYFTIMKTISMKVRSSDSIENIKVMLREKEGILENNQRLEFNDKRLSDGQISDYDICKNSVIRVEDRKKFYVNMPPERKRKMVELEADIFDTISNIKYFIKLSEKIQPHEYSIYYAGKLLEDDMHVSSPDIPSGSTLQMVFNPKDNLSISVETPDKASIVVGVRCSHTVVEAKSVVECLTNWRAKDWDLCIGKMRLMDLKTLAFYDVKEDDVLNMLPALYRISMRTRTGKIVIIEVKQTDTIRSVKEKIFKQTDVPVDRQGLMFGGQILEDNKRLAYYNIDEGYTLHEVTR